LVLLQSKTILHLYTMLRALLSILVVGIFTSCKTIHNLASKDTSASNKSTPKTRQKGDVKFLDNISVTPETPESTRQSAGNSQKTSKVKVSQVAPNTAISPSTIESADALQLKYAIVFDATVEKMTDTMMLRTIDQWWGTRYCLGGNTKDCVDCSAFTRSVLKDMYGIDLPRTAHEQYDATERIEIDQLQPGDLVFFYTSGRRISHCGIYVMNNKFIHASTSQGVTVSDLNDPYWKDRYRGAGRFNRSTDTNTEGK